MGRFFGRIRVVIITQGKTNWKFLLLVFVLATIVGGGILALQYSWTEKGFISTPISQVTSTPQATPTPDVTAGWKTLLNEEFGFELKYPPDFFDLNHEPKILVGDCNYSVFPDVCPSINDLVANDLASAGGDISAIKSNLSYPNYWKIPDGEKSTINNVTYCLYQTGDAAMGHTYNYYYYTTVTNKKCLVANLSTSTANCDFYLPLEKGNAQQQKNYNNCLTTNQNQPKILSQIVATFKFTNQNQTGCNTNSDCQNGAACMVEGPIIAHKPIRKVCVPKGQAVPL